MRRTTLAALLAGAVLLSGCSLLPQEAEEPQITVADPVVTKREIFTVKTDTVESRINLNVSFGSAQQQSLYFRSSGRIKQMRTRVGETVQAGQILAELDTTAMLYDITSAELDLKRKQLTLATALAKKGFVDAPSATDIQKMEWDVQQSEASLAYKQEQLAGLRLIAPFTGRILSVTVVEGDQADAYRELMVIAAVGDVVARATIDDATAAALRTGHPVDIFPNDGDPTPVKGQVTFVPLAGTPAAQKVLLIKPDRPSPRLEAGRNGRVEIILERRENVTVVPLSAVRSFSGRYFVTVVKGETRQEVAIEPGIQSTAYLEVKSGVVPGDRVVSR